MDNKELSKLAEPFPYFDLEWRVQSCGEKNGKIWAKVLTYVTNRAIQERLDEVCGPENWKNYYEAGPGGGVLCGISIKIGGDWVTKWDGAENTNIESVKGGLSDSMKRAGVQWGIGRYLYKLTEAWAEVTDSGSHSGKTKDNKWFKWNPPKLPEWALPDGEKQPAPLVKLTNDVKRQVVEQSVECISRGDDMGLREIWSEFDTDEKVVLWGLFNSQQRKTMTELMGN